MAAKPHGLVIGLTPRTDGLDLIPAGRRLPACNYVTCGRTGLAWDVDGATVSGQLDGRTDMPEDRQQPDLPVDLPRTPRLQWRQ